MLTLVTLIYGDIDRYEKELNGSVMSALKLRRRDSTNIIVYADRPLDTSLPVQQRIISADDWRSWTRDSKLTHLAKMHILKDALETTHGDVIYFDTDTIFLSPPETLGDILSGNTALMHKNEGPIRNHNLWPPVLEKIEPGNLIAGIKISPESNMYNSGIVGLNQTMKVIVDDAISLANELWNLCPIFSIDQFSMGRSIESHARMATCEDSVFHYWGWRRKLVRFTLDRFFDRYGELPFDEMLAKFEPDQFRDTAKATALIKIRAKMRSVQYRLNHDSRFAYSLLLMAMSIGETDAAVANLWFEGYLQFREISASTEQLGTEFLRLLDDKHQRCLRWLSPENARRIEIS